MNPSSVNERAQTVSEREGSGTVRRCIQWLSALINVSGGAVVVVSLVTMFLVVLVNVVLRYFWGSGITWAYELPSILFPWCVAGGIVMSAVQGRHIAVDVLVELLPSSMRRVLQVLVNLFVSLVSAGVVYYAMPIIKASQYSRLAETGIPQVYGYSSLVYAFSMVSCIGLLAAINHLCGGRLEARDPTVTHYS
ncbi:hypothetical protein BFW38_14640 [Terasakiispira papahanaumokuakeensis]|uniref:TRAP transporter small permease protein n=1 Tax=Terasakiispira papahanaumokuakeensis TaxID=197479 RepID=A0A1E2VFQ6_9GAMM|nr:TRAP transporter small permease subunit [Terasakiispira papahanaumokuakeensis]ODC05495.1 hypothetical protein BFW38_14640 [Terasakiispira papahanaumokuakeensis]